MKKLMNLLAALVLVSFMAACGSEADDQGQGTDQGQAQTEAVEGQAQTEVEGQGQAQTEVEGQGEAEATEE